MCAVILSCSSKLGWSAVQAVAEHFGFLSRNHFASAYRELCSEYPRDMLGAACVDSSHRRALELV